MDILTQEGDPARRENTRARDLETLYKKFDFPASSKFLKQLKNEGLKYTKDEVDKFIKGKTEQQQTTIKTEKKKDLGK